MRILLVFTMAAALAACQPAPSAPAMHQTFESEVPLTGVMRYSFD